MRKRGDLFQGLRGSFYIKNELKSEIFNDKKSLSVTTKNLIWGIRVVEGGGGALTKKIA